MSPRALAVAALLLLPLAACKGVPKSERLARRAVEFQDQADAAFAAGNYRKAADLSTAALQLNPGYSEAYYRRGNAWKELYSQPSEGEPSRRMLERAEADYTLAIRHNPVYYEAYFNRAMIHLKFARFRDGARDLLQCIQIQPRDPEPHLYLGELYENEFLEKEGAALDHYAKYVEKGGTDEEIREYVRRMKSGPAPANGAAPSAPEAPAAPRAEDEKAAEDLHRKLLTLLDREQRPEALKVVEELLTTYGKTQFVQRRQVQYQAMKKAFAPKEK